MEGTASEGGSGCAVPGHPVEICCSESESAVGHIGEGYGPFITDGFVSLVGSSEKRLLAVGLPFERLLINCVGPLPPSKLG